MAVQARQAVAHKQAAFGPIVAIKGLVFAHDHFRFTSILRIEESTRYQRWLPIFKVMTRGQYRFLLPCSVNKSANSKLLLA